MTAKQNPSYLIFEKNINLKLSYIKYNTII